MYIYAHVHVCNIYTSAIHVYTRVINCVSPTHYAPHSFSFPPVEPQPKVARHNLTITLDEPSNLTCSVDALPLPTFSWALFKDGYDQPLADEHWSVDQKNGSASSVLTRKFDVSDLTEDCTLIVVCNAENDYGSSRQYFILSLNKTSECASETLQPPSPPPTVSASNQEFEENIEGDDGVQGDDEGDNMFTILSTVFGIGMLCIVAGVGVVLAFFVKHFYNKHRFVVLLSAIMCLYMSVYFLHSFIHTSPTFFCDLFCDVVLFVCLFVCLLGQLPVYCQDLF